MASYEYLHATKQRVQTTLTLGRAVVEQCGTVVSRFGSFAEPKHIFFGIEKFRCSFGLVELFCVCRSA